MVSSEQYLALCEVIDRAKIEGDEDTDVYASGALEALDLELESPSNERAVTLRPTLFTLHPDSDGSDTELALWRTLISYHVELTYVEGASAYCSNPVEIIAVDDAAYEVRVSEVDDLGRTIRGPSWDVPFDIIEKVVIL